MAQPSSNYDNNLVRLGVTGAVRRGPLGLVLPTSMAAWPTGAVDLGWISDEGITENREGDEAKFTPWQTNSPVRVETTSETISWDFTLWTTSFDTVSTYFKVKAEDMDFDETSGVTSFVDGDKKARDIGVWGFDVIDGVYARRIIAPQAEVTKRGSQVYKKDELIGMQCTVTAFPGPDGWSVKREFREGWRPPVAGP